MNDRDCYINCNLEEVFRAAFLNTRWIKFGIWEGNAEKVQSYFVSVMTAPVKGKYTSL